MQVKAAVYDGVWPDLIGGVAKGAASLCPAAWHCRQSCTSSCRWVLLLQSRCKPKTKSRRWIVYYSQIFWGFDRTWCLSIMMQLYHEVLDHLWNYMSWLSLVSCHSEIGELFIQIKICKALRRDLLSNFCKSIVEKLSVKSNQFFLTPITKQFLIYVEQDYWFIYNH